MCGYFNNSNSEQIVKFDCRVMGANFSNSELSLRILIRE